MLGITLFSIFIFIVITIIVIEVRNERIYQEKRRKRRYSGTTQAKEKPKNDVKLEKDKQEELKETKAKKEKQEEKSKEKPKEKKEEKEENKNLPTCKYPKFTHARLVEMGLSEVESKEFVEELIPQLEEQIPLIEVELKNADFHKMERLTHSLKGSTTNLGTGGISDLLVECNTYLKTGTDIDIATVYFEYLKHYTKELREQYL